jgi:hypothetical protein
VPRSGSTAFERMMAERGDLTVFHEPFSIHYYYGAQKRSPRYAEVRDDGDPSHITTGLEASARTSPVFLKDMAYHVAHLVGTEPGDAFLARFVNTFLIRDPARTIPSLAAVWPDFTEEEAGFTALEHLVTAADASRQPVVIVDSDDLRADPEATVRAYCEHVGLPYVSEALGWEPGMQDQWDLWSDWHAETAVTTGFLPPEDAPPPPITDPRAAEVHARCHAVYERLLPRTITPA